MVPNRKFGFALAALAALLLTPAFAHAQSTVTLSPTASPSAGQAGVTVISVMGSGFPSGIIAPASVSVTFQAATLGAGPSGAATATAVTTIIGTMRRITFQIPQSIAVTSPTLYKVSINGSTSTGTTFASGNSAALTINPPPSIVLVNPNSGAPGQTLTVSITTAYTNFLQGSTAASFGVGISVGGAPEGQVGPVTVTSVTTATAQLVIDQNALAGFRTVVVQTGVQQATLANGFNVSTANHPPVANAGGPYTGTVGQTITFDGTKSHDPDGDTLTYTWNFGDTNTNSGTGSGAQPTHVYTAVGTYTVTLTVNDGRGGTDTATTTATIGPVTGPAPSVSITSPAGLALLNTNPITVTGTTNNAADTVTVNGVQATMSGESFSAKLALQEGTNIITATATDPSGNVATASITVTLDTTPPHVTINTPANGSVVTTSTVTVSGLASDITAGTVNTQDVAVTVNGITAQVANRNFLVNAVPLSLGPNTLTAIAVDKAGNTASTSITVVYAPATGKPAISMVSGNNQSGTIGTLLTAPLVVQLKDATGKPVAGQVVVFQVTQNNGTVAGASVTGDNTGRSIAVKTDSNGLAQVTWTLGMRAGAGNNCVMATATNFFGEVDFTAIATPSTPGLISLDAGNTQTGVIGQALPLPFVVVVTDAGHNRLPNIPVTFTVKQGGGSFGGQSSVTLSTDSNGRALAVLTLGMQEGINNNLVEANFVGNTGFPASFTASGQAAGNPAATEVSGVVLDDEDTPIAGVTMSIEGTTLTTQTDQQGQFVLKGVPVGSVKLVADASTAARPGTWELMAYDMVTVAGQNNTLTMPIYLLPLDLAEGIHVDATHGGTITLAAVPGFSLTIPPGSVTFPDGTNSGLVSVTLVHADKVPMTPQFGQQPKFIVSIQPTGAHFNPPAAMTMPNVDGLKPGEVTEMYSYDHDLGMFVAIGTGTVSDDGTVIKSDPGVGIVKGGWHCGGNPTTTGSCCDCGTCQTCTANGCIASGTNSNCGPCWIGGSCGSSGACSGGTPAPLGTSCGSCYNGGYCDGNGNCVQGTSGANGTNCSQNPCLTGQTCQNGTCSGGTPLNAGTPCQFGFNPCATGVCDGSGYCVNVGNAPGGTSCSDLCVSGGTCNSSGQCTGGTTVTCTGGSFCAPQVCDPANGGCTLGTVPVGDNCNPCSPGATCQPNGACSGGAALSSGGCGACITGGTCSNGACVGGIQVADGTSCPAQDACFSGGVCHSGTCVQKKLPPKSDGIICDYLENGPADIAYQVTLQPTQCSFLNDTLVETTFIQSTTCNTDLLIVGSPKVPNASSYYDHIGFKNALPTASCSGIATQQVSWIDPSSGLPVLIATHTQEAEATVGASSTTLVTNFDGVECVRTFPH